MPAYFVVDVLEVKDRGKMEEYRSRVGANVSGYGGRYLAAGGDFEVLEGGWRPTFPVLLEFPSMEVARRWYGSEDYRELKALRQTAARCDVVLIDGLQQAPGGS